MSSSLGHHRPHQGRIGNLNRLSLGGIGGGENLGGTLLLGKSPDVQRSWRGSAEIGVSPRGEMLRSRPRSGSCWRVQRIRDQGIFRWREHGLPPSTHSNIINRKSPVTTKQSTSNSGPCTSDAGWKAICVMPRSGLTSSTARHGRRSRERSHRG